MPSAASLQSSTAPPSGMAVPLSLDELDAEWLTACLRHAGVLGGGSVQTFEAARVGEGKGFAGYLARLSLRYEGERGDAPASLIAKFAGQGEAVRDLMTEVGAYEREVRFYRELADQLGVSTPRCYLAHYDAERRGFVLLLEDMAPAASAAVEEGLTLQQARTVLEEVARYHARFWNRSEGLEWLLVDETTADRFRERFLEHLPAFLEHFGETYPTSARVARALASVLEGDEWKADLLKPPLTLIHNDLHAENVFFPSEAGGRFAVIDWQGVSFARHGTSDVTRILSMGLQPEQRRAHQKQLLRHYHAKLVEFGVEGFPFRALWHRYRQEAAVMAMAGVLALEAIDFEGQEEAAAMMGDRVEQAVRDSGMAWRVEMLAKVMRGLRWLRGSRQKAR
ncbi:MAG: ecdysteroid 22-kinase family protein [Myxococcales bacterium]|nr:ecdysteroid 22-kinase family protein [Myxococcales bacterium]